MIFAQRYKGNTFFNAASKDITNPLAGHTLPVSLDTLLSIETL